nr:PH domain-containing protein [Corynebacterium lubricantis]
MNPVSPKLTYVNYLNTAIWILLFAAAFTFAYVRWGGWWWVGIVAVAVWTLWELWIIPARVRLHRWQETDDELLITKGKLWHVFTVVPYGRIQFVDVTAGPIMRAFGLKNVVLHTASSTSDSTVHGLPAEEADALRERLTVKARERMSGL